MKKRLDFLFDGRLEYVSMPHFLMDCQHPACRLLQSSRPVGLILSPLTNTEFASRPMGLCKRRVFKVERVGPGACKHVRAAAYGVLIALVNPLTAPTLYFYPAIAYHHAFPEPERHFLN